MEKAASDGGPSSSAATDSSTGNKRLTKRKKWQLKWQSRRKRRKEARIPDNPMLTEGQEQSSQGSERVKQEPENSRRNRKRKSEENGDRFKRRRILKDDVIAVAGDRIEVIPKGSGVTSGRNLHTLSTHRDRKRRRKPRNLQVHKEEQEFNKMVEKYRKKLGKTITDT